MHNDWRTKLLHNPHDGKCQHVAASVGLYLPSCENNNPLGIDLLIFQNMINLSAHFNSFGLI